eukprot:CAMPEP_0175851068 /NCGR_PEP_ID=MMETSP0107_2-20121207/25450_1 /TAXON_ID=195067 ORGANISM="Goniomonas pacifica, Strain CCMP1869" /NCGR_SAMPLE_ID=MMETSP0107_2 /ASSEMBLY_ACC=CAM_ASM_000203 /LENGTH=172 /DNA_ID=CAMNT_0017166447 /DNA_START=288 /DNA_END=806 /DNA_ORIENTATION=+
MNLRMKNEAGDLVPLTYKVILAFTMHHHATCICLGFALGMIALVLYAFLGYHLWLVFRNTTTNETFKWRELGRRQQKLRKRIEARLAGEASGEEPAGGDHSGEVGEGSAHEDEVVRRRRVAKAAREAEERKMTLDDIPHLHNIYHLGILQNLAQVLFPPAQRPLGKARRKTK